MKPDLLLNLSASPWHLGSKNKELNLGKVVKKLNCPVAYINSVGGNDELIFDGRSLAMDTNYKNQSSKSI